MKFRRILAPTDFSPLSERGVAEAASLARSLGAELVLLHVVEPAVMGADLYGAAAMATVLEEVHQSSRQALARAVDKIKKRGQRCRGVIGNGGAATAIVDTATRLRIDLIVLATHGRGIWIVDDITPWRALTPELLPQEAAFVSARPVQQRIEGNGGWANGDAVFIGDNPPDAAVITYYQKARHLFGKLKLEVLDSSGQVVDELPASKRPGLNRVIWSMRAKPPRVPPAAQVAFNGIRGPRLVPGVYTVRLTKNGKATETKLTIGLDRRAKFSDADRKAQFDAAMKVRGLFEEESALMDRILFLRDALAKASSALPESDPLKKRVSDFDGKVDAVRKQIVATKEGGAITGEERLREHTDQLYGALLSYEGKPGDYQLAYFEALKRELADVSNEFAGLVAKDLPALNDALKAKGQSTISPPPEKVAVNDATANFPGGGSVGGQIDHDGPAGKVTLPADFRILR
jgi:nucleotide-binding universal stress UspA family protein